MASLNDIAKVMKEALEKQRSENFIRVANLLSNTKDDIRETIQAQTAEQILSIIKKLSGTDPLTPEEIDYMRLWLVGDAESYTEMENNFDDWVDELRRLTRVIDEYADTKLTINEMFGLQGILEDAIRTSMDIKNFLEKKERIDNFRQATKDPASLDRDILIQILRGKQHSSEV